jgi:hypothetical protein
MSKTRQEKRSKVKPFIKVVNYNHLMPTRYTLELEGLKGVVSNDTFKEVSQREEAKKTVKKVLEERYTSGKNRWFFTPLSKLMSKRHSKRIRPKSCRTNSMFPANLVPRILNVTRVRAVYSFSSFLSSCGRVMMLYPTSVTKPVI